MSKWYPMSFKEPLFVEEWRRTLRIPTPRCCHTCANFNGYGFCVTYFKDAPEEYMNTENKCLHWIEDRVL